MSPIGFQFFDAIMLSSQCLFGDNYRRGTANMAHSWFLFNNISYQRFLLNMFNFVSPKLILSISRHNYIVFLVLGHQYILLSFPCRQKDFHRWHVAFLLHCRHLYVTLYILPHHKLVLLLCCGYYFQLMILRLQYIF